MRPLHGHPHFPFENAAVLRKKVTESIPERQGHIYSHSRMKICLHGMLTVFSSAMAAQDSPQPLGDVLKEVIDQLGLQEKIDEARVVETWATIAGKDINGVTESVWMKGSTLYVKITSAAWRQELHMNRRQWRQRLNGALESDPVEEIVFR
jgi:predicted nucleic acid-binding Zn ribbon protein